jgi:hypothetical protein
MGLLCKRQRVCVGPAFYAFIFVAACCIGGIVIVES